MNRMHRLHLHMRERSLAVSEMHQPPRLSLAALHSENGDSDDAAQSHRIESLPRQHEPQQLVSRSGCNEPPEAPDSDDILSTGLSGGACMPQTPCFTAQCGHSTATVMGICRDVHPRQHHRPRDRARGGPQHMIFYHYFIYSPLIMSTWHEMGDIQL